VNPYPDRFPRCTGEAEPLGEIPQAEACCEEYDGIELLEKRVPVGSKEIGERVQHYINDVNRVQRSIPKGLSKTCQYQLEESHMEEAKLRYRWVEDLVSSDVKAIGTYLAMLNLLGPRHFNKYRNVDKLGDFIMTSEVVKKWLAFYFAGKAEYIREAYEAGKEFVDKLFANEPSALDSYERNIILGEIEFNFYNNFLMAFKKYLKLANIPEELRGIVREVLFDVRTQVYGGSLITHAGTTTIREDTLKKNIEDYRKLKGEDTNKLILCMEKSGLILK
jgi:hypothetical protein